MTRDERGQVGGAEAVAFGVLVLVLGTLGLASAWAVVDTKVAVASAAREAARAYVESDGGDAAWAEAGEAARSAFAGGGHDPQRLRLSRTPRFGRCEPVTVAAEADLVLPRVPLLREAARRVRVRADHTEVVDPYRSGLGARRGGCTAG